MSSTGPKIVNANRTTAGVEAFVDKEMASRQPQLAPGGPTDRLGGLPGQYNVPVAAPSADDNYLAFMQAITDPAKLKAYLPDAPGIDNSALRNALGEVGKNSLVQREPLAAIAQSKAEEARHRNFQSWVGTKFDLTNLYELEKYNKLMPEMKEMRARQIENAYAVSGRMHALNLIGGPQTRDDLEFMFAVEQGDLVPAEMLFKGKIPGYNPEQQETGDYKKGMFAPMNTLATEATEAGNYGRPTSQAPGYNWQHNYARESRQQALFGAPNIDLGPPLPSVPLATPQNW